MVHRTSQTRHPMTPHEQATKLVHDYYAKINGSPLGEVVNEEALSEAIERAKVHVSARIHLAKNPHALNHHKQVLNKLNEM
jgi:hypothetical protein